MLSAQERSENGVAPDVALAHLAMAFVAILIIVPAIVAVLL